MKAPYIPEDAPFSGDQRAWLGGFLAGLHSRIVMSGNAAPAESGVQAKPIHILFGTQTGNAEEVANEAATLARTRGFAPKVEELDAIAPEQLATMEHVIVVVSTYGEGEMPDNAALFWEAFSSPTAPRLEGLKYGVLGLGDTSYDQFCQAAKLIDMRFEQLGATRLGDRVDCDVDYEEVATGWLNATLPTSENATAPVPAREGAKLTKSGWSRKNPYVSQVIDNHVLSGPNSAKEIRHIAFDLGESGMSYEAGDALGVMPINNPEYVEAILTRLNVPAETAIAGHDAPLAELLTRKFEIMTPSKELIKALAPLSGDEEFVHVVKNGDKEALEAWLWGRDLLDLLELNPTLPLDPAEVVSWLKPLQHRAYSISSSPKAHKGEVHLTVAAVRWSYNNRPHHGVCSTFLADHVPVGENAGIFMSHNKAFRVPQDDSVPMIMVGPGTGIAPFRAFLEERQARGASGTNWLFFGDQHRASDFIYEDEITAMQESGLLSRLDLAFSRDQAEKIYVQTRMRESGKDLYAMLQEGGHFYVCGDATRMARDVDTMLHSVIETEGGMSTEEASDYVKRLKREKRYVRDVY